MGQLGTSFEELSFNLKEIGEEVLHICYSPEEIVDLILKDEDK